MAAQAYLKLGEVSTESGTSQITLSQLVQSLNRLDAEPRMLQYPVTLKM